MKANQFMQLINQIPVDQEAAANYPIKKFLLEKVRIIFNNKKTIQNAAIQKKADDVIEAYKKSVGFTKRLAALTAARNKEKAALKNLVETGLDDGGRLLSVCDRGSFGNPNPCVYMDSDWRPISDETAKKIEKVNELIAAVKGQVEPFTWDDQIETRMMMSTKMGEVMACINAVAGEQVFKIKTELLGLPEK